MHNKKSIGNVNNNLGNVMLIMYLAMENCNVKRLNGMTKEQIIRKGIAFYQDAIELGEEAYDDFGKSKSGSLNSARAYAGYAFPPDGRKLAFCIMVNNYTVSSRKVNQLLLDFQLLLCQSTK